MMMLSLHIPSNLKKSWIANFMQQRKICNSRAKGKRSIRQSKKKHLLKMRKIIVIWLLAPYLTIWIFSMMNLVLQLDARNKIELLAFYISDRLHMAHDLYSKLQILRPRLLDLSKNWLILSAHIRPNLMKIWYRYCKLSVLMLITKVLTNLPL